MSTSGTYNFNPSLGEITLYAYQLIGVRPTAVLQEHIDAARTATNMMFTRWSNQGVNLWQVVPYTQTLTQGLGTYSVDPNAVVILDAFITTTSGSINTDRIILPISRTEYLSYPNKSQQGFPTTFWFNRLLAPTITLWPVPDGSQTSLTYYSVYRIQDANMNGTENLDMPAIWLEAMVYGLAERLAQIWAPDKIAFLKPMADEAYTIAANQNIETAGQYISPQLSGYWR
jgi:hypothetical protein